MRSVQRLYIFIQKCKIILICLPGNLVTKISDNNFFRIETHVILKIE